MDRERNCSLDVLRITATVLIIFHHYQQITGAYFEGHINFFNGRFYFGYLVEFFFLLSGYFMYRYVEKIREGLSFEAFFVPRALRLLPLVFVSSVAEQVFLGVYKSVCGGGTGFDNVSISIWGLVLNAFGLQTGWVFNGYMINNPTWYISVLMLCYVVFYLLSYLVNAGKYHILISLRS